MERGKLATAATRALRRFKEKGVRVDSTTRRIRFTDSYGRDGFALLQPFVVVWYGLSDDRYEVSTHRSAEAVERAIRRQRNTEMEVFRWEPVAAYDLARGKKLKLNRRVSAV